MVWTKFPINRCVLSIALSVELSSTGGFFAVAQAQSNPSNFPDAIAALAHQNISPQPITVFSHPDEIKISQIASNQGNEFEPPDRGTPGSREGGGTRGSCPLIRAFIPNSTAGGTTSAQPTLFYYISDALDKAVEFILTDDATGKEFIAEFQMKTDAPGIVSLPLSKIHNLPSLEVDKYYRWDLTIKCKSSEKPMDSSTNSDDSGDSSSDLFVAGWIKRVARTDTRFLWYDALSSLVEKRLSSSFSPSSEWAALLSSVGLDKYIQQPIIPSQIIPLPTATSGPVPPSGFSGTPPN